MQKKDETKTSFATKLFERFKKGKKASAPKSTDKIAENNSSPISQHRPIKTKSIYEKLPNISHAPRNNIPLSDGQLRLAYLEQLNPDFSSYNWLISFVFQGKLDLEAFEKSLRHLINRHESFRTAIDLETQCSRILKPDEIEWKMEVEPIHSGDDPDIQTKICSDYAQLKFDLKKPPLLRSKIFTYRHNNVEKYLWCCSVSHIVFDGYSQKVFLQELSKCYSLYIKGVEDNKIDKNLPELPIQFVDYANWNKNFPKEHRLKQLQFWNRTLKDHTYLELPTDRPRPKIKSFKGSRVAVDIPPHILLPLRYLSEITKSSLFTVLLASFQCLLYFYTGQTDICTGTMTANRKKGMAVQWQLENVIGFIANTIPIRTHLDPKTFLITFIHSVLDCIEQAIHQNSDISFGEVVNTVAPPYDPSRNPFFETLFVMQHPDYQSLQLPDIQTSSIERGWQTSRFDLVLEMRAVDERLVGFFEYNTEIFAHSTVQRMAHNFVHLLSQFRTHTHRPIYQMNILSPQELTLLNQFHPTIDYEEQNFTLPQMISHIVNVVHDKVAVQFENSQITYGELEEASTRIAQFIHKKGLEKKLIGLCMERSIEAILTMLGIIKAGCSVIFLETTKEEINSTNQKLYKFNVNTVIHHSKTEDLFTTDNVSTQPPLQQLAWKDIYNHIKRNSANTDEPLNVKVSITDTVLVSTTSGTSGLSKGVPTSHRGWVNWINYFRNHGKKYNLSPESKIFQGATFSFDASFWEIFITLGIGGTLYLNSNVDCTDPLALEKFFAMNKITVATWTPSFLATLKPRKFKTLTSLFVIGEKLSENLVNNWQRPGLEITNGYGPAEASGGVTLGKCEKNKPVTIGKPISNMNIEILDEFQKPVPIGCYGEIYISGVGVAEGYLNDEERSKQVFVDDPQSLMKRYRTGDKGRFLESGCLEFADRISGNRQIKLHGIRVDLEEIETALDQHPNIERSHIKLIQGEQDVLAAYYTSKNNVKVPPYEFENFLRQTGLSTAKIPTFFINIASFPLTNNGKLNERALPPVNLKATNILNATEPRNEIESTLLKIWKGILPHKEINIQFNFRDCGGDSYKLILLHNEIKTVFFKGHNNPLVLADFKGEFTIESLAKKIKLKISKRLTGTNLSQSIDNLYLKSVGVDKSGSDSVNVPYSP